MNRGKKLMRKKSMLKLKFKEKKETVKKKQKNKGHGCICDVVEAASTSHNGLVVSINKWNSEFCLC